MAHRSRRHQPVSDASLPVQSRGEIPLREVSGLAVGPGTNGIVLVAVGDRGPDVAYASIDDDARVGAWVSIDLSLLPAPPGAPAVVQAEAIALDGAGSAVVLIEDPALLLLLDIPGRRLVSAFRLDTSGTGVAGAWASDASSRGEGVVLMRDGHVLVVKEKHPAGLLEFGPAGAGALGVSPDTLLGSRGRWDAPPADVLAALAWWPADGSLDDYSDAAVGPDGALYVLSDQSAAIGRVDLPLTVGAPAATVSRRWELDHRIDKAEGLAFLPDGTAVVAVDRPDHGRNLAFLPPLAQWPAGEVIRPA